MQLFQAAVCPLHQEEEGPLLLFVVPVLERNLWGSVCHQVQSSANVTSKGKEN